MQYSPKTFFVTATCALLKDSFLCYFFCRGDRPDSLTSEDNPLYEVTHQPVIGFKGKYPFLDPEEQVFGRKSSGLPDTVAEATLNYFSYGALT